MQKKAVLYNTTIDAFLKYGEKALRKMEYVFHFFEQKDDLALIWRPHPLLEATLRSMRPELLGGYLKMVGTYKSRRIGILDESSDLHRAIALSDAYYGDWSSLADLYQVTGKPILIQDIEVLRQERLPIKWAFHAYTVHICQDRMYMMAPKGDALFCKEKNGKLSIIKYLTGGSMQALLYGMSVFYEGKIFFAPWNIDCFLSYDTNSSEVIRIPMEESPGNEIFYLVQRNGEMRAVGMSSMKVYRYDKMVNLFRCILPGCEKRELFASKRIRTYAHIPFVDKKTNELCIYNSITNQWKVYPFFQGIIRDLLYDGEWCWLITETGSIVKWDISAGICLEERKISVDSRAEFLFDCGDKLLLLSKKGAMRTEVEKETLQMKSETVPELEDGLQHCFSEIIDGQILVESYRKNRGWHLFADESFRVYDSEKKAVTWQDLSVGDESCRAELEKLYAAECWTMAKKKSEILKETPNQSLDFLCALLSAEAEERPITVQPCGEKIHRAMMEDA